MNWKDRRVLVTGAGGFIGSHLCEQLTQTGANVTALIRYNSRGYHGYLEDLPKNIRSEIKVVLGDIRDEDVFRLHLKDQDIVYHLAAMIGIPYSFVHPHDVFETNVLGSLNLLNCARNIPVEKIVMVSTAETYGDIKYSPIDEQHPQFPKSPYAASKAAMENLTWSFYYTYSLPLTIVRLFNNFGPRQSARAITPTIITQMLTSNEVRVGSLHPTRDFTFVIDTTKAMMKVGELESSGDLFNIGSDNSVSVKDIIDKVAKILGKDDIKIIVEKTRIRPNKSEVGSLRADYSRLRNRTEWNPEYSYEEGLRVTINWIEKRLNIYKPENYSI